MPDRSTSIVKSRLSVDENEPPTSIRQLSRSPHPYHRQSGQLQQSSLDLHQGRIPGKPIDAKSTFQGRNQYYNTNFVDSDSRKRRKISASPSESGTEADDERPVLLKGLPAPPLRSRKGLKSAGGLGADSGSSPLLTPSALDHVRESPMVGEMAGFPCPSRPRAEGDTAAWQKEAKIIRRRQAELLRRVLEAMSLAAVGYLGARSSTANLLIEIRYHVLVVVEVYAVYALRQLRRWYLRHNPSSVGPTYSRFRIPVAYDPAPLLYPVFLPLFVAVSLAAANPAYVLPNIILGICSLPAEMIPLCEYDHDLFHWIISLIPYTLISLHSGNPSASLSDGGLKKVDPEVLTLLYPLHRALKASLGFLCTTSLLPSELQLLSVALINLLLYSTSPQAIILQALLWIGGVTLYIFCKHVLRWTVDLARVPSWRFRPGRHASHGRNIVFRAIDDSFGGILSRNFGGRNKNNSSDSDSGQNLATRKRRPEVSAAPRDTRPGHNPFLPRAAAPTVAADDIGHLPTAKAEERLNSARSASGVHRRHTLPAHLSGTGYKMGPKHSLYGSRLTRPKSYRSLTTAQASVVKWLYSLYVFMVVAATIVFPIRRFIGQRALQNSEPVGWALGYLLGDLPAFRLQTVKWNLERWICLPWRVDHQNLRVCRGEYFRRVTLGASTTRLLICAYCTTCITAGLLVVFRLSAVVEVDTRRKVFHGMMVAMFLPTIFVDPPFIALAFALILSIFLLLDLFRASQLPPISKPLTFFLAPYVDGRDHRGPIIVSHIFLLIGCAIPLWLSLAATPREGIQPFGGWDVTKRDMSMIGGVVCVGMGDAAASLIGRRYGRRRWPWSGGKSLEGSLAFAVAVVLGLAAARTWLLLGGWDGDSGDKWVVTLGKASIAAAGSSITEAVLTGGNDNVIVPVILWLLIRGLEM